MNQATKTRMTFKDYLAYDDETDKHYEFECGEGVPEYWAIDSDGNKITVFTLVNGFYEEAIYIGKMVIQSRFEVLQLTDEQVLKHKR